MLPIDRGNLRDLVFACLIVAGLWLLIPGVMRVRPAHG